MFAIGLNLKISLKSVACSGERIAANFTVFYLDISVGVSMHSGFSSQERRINPQPNLLPPMTKLPSALSIPIFAQRAVERCHVTLPDSPEPTGAIHYEGQYYVYVKFFPTLEVANQKAALLVQRGNTVLMTRVPKGLVLWALELGASPAQKVTKT
jgi:hypothetical protein